MRRLPIFWLTLRQFRAGKAIRVVAFFAAIPILLAVIRLLGSENETVRQFVSGAFLEALAPTILPLATLILATSAFGNEISDRTLPYVVLKPIRRARIVLEKYVGAAAVLVMVFVVGLVATWAVAAAGGPDGLDGRVLLALLLASTAGILAYGALFMLVSLAVPRALMVGIIYVLVWESLLARFVPGIRLVSIRFFTDSVYVQTLSDPNVMLANAMRLSGALIVLGVVVVVSLALASVRLRAMELD